MRKQMLAVLAALLLSLPSLMAQEIPTEVISAFQKGNVQGVAAYMGDQVNIVLQGASTTGNKQNATVTLQNFFAGNKVSGFTVNHQGKRDESSFLVGTLTTVKGHFRVNCFLRKAQNRYLIYQIRIDRINE
jgi:hypothetical protein